MFSFWTFVGDGDDQDEEDEETVGRKLKLKGQMIFMDDWDAFLFLATPM